MFLLSLSDNGDTGLLLLTCSDKKLLPKLSRMTVCSKKPNIQQPHLPKLPKNKIEINIHSTEESVSL
jgi:hypothetical protein